MSSIIPNKNVYKTDHDQTEIGHHKLRNYFFKEVLIICVVTFFWLLLFIIFALIIGGDFIYKLIFIFCALLFIPGIPIIIIFKNYSYIKKGIIVTNKEIVLPDITIPFNSIKCYYWNPSNVDCLILFNSIHSIPNYPYTYYTIQKLQIFDENAFLNAIKPYINLNINERKTLKEIK